MRKRDVLILTGVTTVVVSISAIGGILGLKAASALTNSGQLPSIVENIASKFGLKTSDVQQVFDDTRTQAITSRLDTLVTEDKITADQEKLIIVKLADVQKQVDAINSKQLTATERQTEMQTLRIDTSKWATDNKIPEQYLVIGGGLGGRGGMGGGMGRGMMGGGL